MANNTSPTDPQALPPDSQSAPLMTQSAPTTARAAPPEPPPLEERVLYRAGTCVAVNKLTGEAVEGAKAGQRDLREALAVLLAGKGAAPADALPRPEAVHRLDIPVSGCALFARTRHALAFLNEAFGGNAALESGPLVGKRYWAIVEKPAAGFPLRESGELVHWLTFDSAKNKSFARNRECPNSKKAALRYRLAGAGKNYLFLEIELVTGRHHQIRAQLAACGLHIKGDLKYGAKRSDPGGGIRLHARSLSFPNPSGGEDVSVTADPPLCDNLWLAFRDAARQGGA